MHMALAFAVMAAASSTPIDTIVVEATKEPISIDEQTSRITLIEAERIRGELIQNIDDLVRFEPGVDVADQGSRFGFSGISIRGVGGNRVQIEVDGIPVADAFSIGSFSNAGRDFVDVDTIRQVEISRGPASALFGSDALGGVVSFVTQTPDDVLGDRTSHLAASLGYNDVDASRVVSATAAQRLGRWSGMLRVTERSGEERDSPVADPLQSDSLNLLARFGYGDTREGGLLLTLERFEGDSRTEVDSLEGESDLTALFGFPYSIETTRVAADDQRTRLRVALGQEWRGGVGGLSFVRWRAYHQESETSQDTFEARSTFIAGNAGAVERNRSFVFDQQLQGGEVNFGQAVEWGGIAHQLSFGAEYERAETAQIRAGVEADLITGSSSNTVGPDTFPVRDFPLSRTTRSGIYIQDRVVLGDWSLSPGLRWDRFTLDPRLDSVFAADNPGITPVDLDDSRVSPKFGVTWQASNRIQLYAQYAEGFRAPPVNDVNVGFTNLQFGYTALPNPDLKSETSEGLELGLRAASETSSLEVAVFQTDYDDFIESFQVVGFDPILQVLQFQSVNVGEVRIRGAEFSAEYSPGWLPEGWRLRAAAAWADGENRDTGQPVNSIAPLNGVLGLEYARPDGTWSVSGVMRAAERQEDLDESNGELLQPAGYAILDVFGYWQPVETVRLRAGVFNVLDRDYTPYLDVQGVLTEGVDPLRFQRPGRTFNVALDWNF